MKKTLALLLCALFVFACSTKQPRLNADESMKKGLALFQKKDYSQAIPMFENTIMEAENPDIAAKAQLFLADCYFLDKQFVEAIPAYQQYLDIYSSSPDANIAMLRLGLSHYALVNKMDRDMGAVEGALRAFTALREKDPAFAKEYELTKKIVGLREMLAERELYVAKFYIRIGQPVAGMKRLENILLNYKDTPTYEDGLFLYASRIAEEPGKEGDAIKLFNILIKQNPDTKYAKDVAKELANLLAKVTEQMEQKQKAEQKGVK